MSNDKRPAFRLKFRSKDKVTYDVGVAWPGRFPDSFDFSPQMTSDESAKFPKLSMEEALRRHANREGWLSLVDATPKQRDDSRGNGQQKAGGYGGGDPHAGSDFGDQDIPFSPWVMP